MEGDKLLSSSNESCASSNDGSKETIKTENQFQKNILSEINSKNNNLNAIESQTTKIQISKKHLIWFASVMIVSLLMFVIIISLILVLTVKTSQLTQQRSNLYGTEENERQVIKMGSIASQILRNKISKPEFIISPAATSALPMESVTLNCKFNTDVNCYWMRNEQTVDIEDRYQYVQVFPKSDCSIKINLLDEIDFGSWQCGCHGSDQYNGIKSDPALVTKSLVLIRASSNKTSKIDKSVILECSFNQAVSCFWMRNGGLIDVLDRYSFVQSSSNNDDSRTDCSIKIRNVQAIDFASWICGASNEKPISSPIFLNREIQEDSKDFVNYQPSHLMINELVQKESDAVEFVEQPADVTAKKGSKVRLNCKFARPVTCAWLRNDQHVDIQGRYQYNNNNSDNNKKDCSITISALQSNDMGQWICSSMADSNGDGVKSQKAIVKIS